MQPAGIEVTIREFQPGDEAAFRRLNEAWITRYFTMEPKDEESLGDPRGYILDRGGRIFFAVIRGETVGCCALIPTRPAEFEVAKMAVSDEWRGRGIGRRILETVIALARAAGAVKLVLETNSMMIPAIALYESVGFRHVPRREVSPYARSNLNMEIHLDQVESPSVG
jgi:ribosomal protein S18 acetylase RimI-like enzyme